MGSLKPLQMLALEQLTEKELIALVTNWWGRPNFHSYFDYFLKRLTGWKLSKVAIALPWDHPVGRKIHFFLHKKQMKRVTPLLDLRQTFTTRVIYKIIVCNLHLFLCC